MKLLCECRLVFDLRETWRVVNVCCCGYINKIPELLCRERLPRVTWRLHRGLHSLVSLRSGRLLKVATHEGDACFAEEER